MYLQVWPSEERNQLRRNSVNIIFELTFLWLKSHLELNRVKTLWLLYKNIEI